MTVTLRIKQCYLEAISDTSKRVEFRESKEYYHRLFKHPDKVKKVRFHFQTKRLVECEVEKIEHIELNDQLKFYAIHLGPITLER